ncbi:MAG TPA: hypothetical protein VGO35_01535 [Gammaproteobacteria bacterium]|nr:hypothetical protein [Gammaproteobacteria bacterium]
MSKVSILYAITGLIAVAYGLLLLWSTKHADQESGRQDWMNSEEVTKSRFNSLQNMRYLMRPDRQNISFSKSKGRAYAMIGIGIALIVMAFT